MGLRRAGREMALKALYQIDIVNDRSLDNLRSQFESMPADPRAREFAVRLVRGVCGDLEHLDELLDPGDYQLVDQPPLPYRP